MNGSLKKSSRILYGVCSCIIVLMVICYFGVSNTKGTYSADGQVTCDGTIYSGTKAWHSGEVYYCCPASTSEMTGGRCYYYNNDCGSKAQCDDVNPTGANWSCSTSYESVLTGYKRTCSVSAVRAISVSDDSPSSGACYICLGTSGSVSTGGEYKQSNSSPGANCHITSSTSCSGTPTAKKYECTLTDNSKVCVTAYDSAWASADVGETGTSCKEVTSCSPTPGGGPTGGGGTNPPSSSSSSKPSSSSSSSKPSSISTTLSSSSSNVDDNPKTGSVAIFMVWVIALGTLIYSFVYFKQSKFE